jgi:hypothetical protein
MKKLLLLLTSAVALTAIIGGGMMLATPDGSSLQLSHLLISGTSFKNFAIPGFVLLVIIGGSNLIATFTLMQRHNKAFTFSLATDLLVIGWIIIQMILTGITSRLHFFYLSAGIIILLISFQLKGKALI